MESFSQFGEWTWITLGIALLGLELLAPGTFFMWLGLAALGVGAIAFSRTYPGKQNLSYSVFWRWCS